jgi:dTDP-glucose 4,6-dehydratase
MTNQDIFKGNRYLVTGGAGFLGSHLSEELLTRGAQVIAVDDFITGRKTNVVGLNLNSGFEFVERDVTEGISIDGPLAGIFHLASPASPVDYGLHPIETLRAGALGADNVLSLAVEKGCPVLVASTSEVYGDPQEHPQRESYWGHVNPIGPRGCYDESKRYQEALTMAYHRVYGASTRVVRIFNTYGPRMRANDGRVVPNFCVQALRGEPLTVYGDGTQTRSFCYVGDLIDGILKLFGVPHHDPVNIGNPSEHTILDFARRIIALAGSKSTVIHRPLPVDDPKVRCPDISKAEKLLGWRPQVSLEEGLMKTLEYFRQEEAETGPVAAAATSAAASAADGGVFAGEP